MKPTTMMDQPRRTPAICLDSFKRHVSTTPPKSACPRSRSTLQRAGPQPSGMPGSVGSGRSLGAPVRGATTGAPQALSRKRVRT